MLEATHARPRLVLAAHPSDPTRADAFWLAGGRLVDSGPLPTDAAELVQRTRAAVARSGPAVDIGAHVPPDEIDEVRILGGWLAAHPEAWQLVLSPATAPAAILAFAARAVSPPAPVARSARARSGRERELDDGAPGKLEQLRGGRADREPG